ncbi:MAG: hypothetical protein DDT32_01764 [Syntrophomonadaceae bacterium]|nr:hypothetical protein [Bacillota bacterium]MBT9147995.1 hypothetical protein [Bacillota bacterium]
MKKQGILVSVLVAACVLLSSGCTSRQIAPSTEEILPIPTQPLEYIALPPATLGKLLFSYETAGQENIWREYRGKWVLWVGSVHEVEPKLKPSRIIFLHEYETSQMAFHTGKFGVIVEFEPAWTNHLNQLITGQTVYYRAKLVSREPAGFSANRYGLGFGSQILMLEEGQIIGGDEIAAKLVDLAYVSYEQLDRLVKEAESIATVSNYFEQRLELLGGKWIAIRAVLSPLGIKIPNSPTPSQTILVDKQRHKIVLQDKIEASLKNVLTSVHTAAPAQENHLRQYIQEALETNRKLASEIDRDSEPLKEMWQKARQSSVVGLGDLLEAGIGQLLPIIGDVLVAKQALDDYLEREPVEQAIITSHALLQKIAEHMEQVSENVVGACRLVLNQPILSTATNSHF